MFSWASRGVPAAAAPPPGAGKAVLFAGGGVTGHRRAGRQPEGAADLAHRWGIPVRFREALNEGEDLRLSARQSPAHLRASFIRFMRPPPGGERIIARRRTLRQTSVRTMAERPA